MQFEQGTSYDRSTLFAKVSTVTNATDIAITVYGGSTDENLDDNSIVTLLGRPKNEATNADPDNGYEPETKFNYTQIMDRTAKVSKTSVEIPKYGIGGALGYQVERQLMDLSYEVGMTTINMPRVQRTSGEAGTM